MTTPLARHIPALATILGEKPTTLYERQRELLREGLLQALPGRGRGSGVQATPEAIALVLCSLMASPSLTGAGPRTRAMAESMTAPPASPTPCGLTGATRFAAALARILSDEARAERVKEIRVRTGDRLATIEYEGGGPTIFVDPDRDRPDPFPPGINTVNSIYHGTVRELASLVVGLGVATSGSTH